MKAIKVKGRGHLYTWRHFFENLAGVFIISYYIPNIQGMDII